MRHPRACTAVIQKSVPQKAKVLLNCGTQKMHGISYMYMAVIHVFGTCLNLRLAWVSDALLSGEAAGC